MKTLHEQEVPKKPSERVGQDTRMWREKEPGAF